jgi:Sel1 repeat
MNISRQFFGTTYCCCLIALVGCASNQMSNMAGLQQRADNGDAVAQRELGEKYDFGHEVQQSYTEAARWYQLAAEQRDAIAQNNLGSLYQYGLGVATNYSKAFELYQKSANQGFSVAESNLGYMYDYGLGVSTNETIADSWYQRAAEHRYPKAMVNLAINYVEGRGVVRDIPRGYMWLQMAWIFTERSNDINLKNKILRMLNKLKGDMTQEELKTGQQLADEQYYKFTGHYPMWDDYFFWR